MVPVAELNPVFLWALTPPEAHLLTPGSPHHPEARGGGCAILRWRQGCGNPASSSERWKAGLTRGFLLSLKYFAEP